MVVKGALRALQESCRAMFSTKHAMPVRTACRMYSLLTQHAANHSVSTKVIGLTRRHVPRLGALTRHRAGNQSCCSLHPTAASAVVAAATLYPIPYYMLMVFGPRWKTSRALGRSEGIFVPLGLAYLFLLIHSWQADTLSLILPGNLEGGFTGGFNPQFFPSLTGIATLFSRLTTAASLWLHLICINLFAACRTFAEGLERNIPTQHSIVLCIVFGPLGLLSHLATKAVIPSRRELEIVTNAS